jgi:cell division protein FtsX
MAVILPLVAAACSSSSSSTSVPATGQVRAYIDGGSSRKVVDLVRSRLLRIPHVASVRYLSPAQLLKRLSKAEQAQVRQLGINPLPARFDIAVDTMSNIREVVRAAGRIPQIASCNSVPCVTYGHLQPRTP